MCQVLASQILETCVDSSIVVRLRLDRPIDEACMRRMGTGGKLDFFPDFPRPLFRIHRRGSWAIQGILGDDTLRVTYLPGAPPSTEDELNDLIRGGTR